MAQGSIENKGLATKGPASLSSRVSTSHYGYNHHYHRPVTMITTIRDHNHENQGEDRKQPLQNHLRTENTELPIPFHMVAEHRMPADHHPPQERAMTIDPSSPTASSLGCSTSQCSMSFLPLQHLDHLDPHELPDDLWTSPSSSSGGGPPETSDDQLDRLYDSHPRSHQQLSLSSSTHQVTHLSGGVSSSGSTSSGMPLATTAGQTSTALAIRPIGASSSVPTTKSRGRTPQGSSQMCSGHPSLSFTSGSSMATTPFAAVTSAGPAHHELYAQHGEQHQNISHNQWRLTHPCQQEDHLLPPSSVGKTPQPQNITYQDIQGSRPGVIHPRCPANIVEIILMEIEQINIDNNKLEEIVISFPLSSSIAIIGNHQRRTGITTS